MAFDIVEFLMGLADILTQGMVGIEHIEDRLHECSPFAPLNGRTTVEDTSNG